MKNLLKKIRLGRRPSAITSVESLSYQNKLYEQTIYWKASVGTNYFVI